MWPNLFIRIKNKIGPCCRKPRLFVDMDGVLAAFNKEATEDDLKRTEGYWKSLPAQTAVVNAVRKIAADGFIEVWIITHYLPDADYVIPEKNAWKSREIPEVPLIFAEYGKDKAKVVESVTGKKVTKNDILLDDFTKNLEAWEAAGGTGIKLLNGINDTHGSWKGLRIHKDECPAVLRTAIELA